MIRLGATVRLAGTIAIGAGLGLLIYVGLVVARATPRDLPRPVEAPSAAAPAPLEPRRVLVSGESLGQIHIERIGLKAEISEGESESVLRLGAGHLADTAWLGEGGNVVLAGHRDTIFRALRNIHPGDVIDIVTAGQSVQYVVEVTKVVAPTDMTVLEPSGGSTLTLVTCYPFTFIGSAPNRFIVRAREIRPIR